MGTIGGDDEDVLDPANNAGYGTWRLPAVRDGQIADRVAPLALLWRSAEVLGLDARAEFLAAERRADATGGALTRFAERSPADRAIAAMGYREVDDEFGFAYERTW